jgi:hypothetical protein
MSVPACGNGRACEGVSSEVEANPRARRSPLEGAVNPRGRRNLLEGGVDPRARRNLLEGAFEWATPVGRGGHRSVGCAPCVRLSEMCLVWFFAGFKQDFPSCFRGPSGLSPTPLLPHRFRYSSATTAATPIVVRVLGSPTAANQAIERARGRMDGLPERRQRTCSTWHRGPCSTHHRSRLHQPLLHTPTPRSSFVHCEPAGRIRTRPRRCRLAGGGWADGRALLA